MDRTPWASIARIEVDGKHSGTGFLVSGKYVLTALHVVGDKETGQPYRAIRLFFDTSAEFEDRSPAFETSASLAKEHCDIEYDFALLECKEVPAQARPFRLTDRCMPFDRCTSPGFAIQKPEGFTVSGYLASLNEPMKAMGNALGVQFDFGSGVRMRGHSGAPLLVRDRVVGLLRTAFEEDEVSVGGIVHATAIQHVVEFFERVLPRLLSCRPKVNWTTPGSTQSPLLLADRKPQFELFRRMIAGQSRERILLLEGDSGFGKTSLMDELANYVKPLGIPAGKADCKGAPPISALFDSLLLSFAPALFPGARAASGAERYSLLVEEIAELGLPVVLQIDTWEESGEAVANWVTKTILPALSTTPGLIVMIAGPKLEALTGICPADHYSLQPLQPITSTADWHDYAVRRWPDTGLTTAHVDALVLTNFGVPIKVDATLALLQGMLRRALPPGGAQ